eukprot:2200963-Prymnesium_polylepis.2
MWGDEFRSTGQTPRGAPTRTAHAQAPPPPHAAARCAHTLPQLSLSPHVAAMAAHKQLDHLAVG